MSGLPGGTGELHGSPQAVFTSFKLPKPGGPSGPGGPGLDPAPSPLGIIPPGPSSPVTSQYSGFGSRLFPLGLGNPPLTNNVQTTPPKINAPLGGLPALADQLLMQNKPPLGNNPDGNVEGESNNNKADKEESRSPPGTPPPSKRKMGDGSGGEGSDQEGTPPKNPGLIKARGTYYPLTAFPTSMPQGPVMRQGESPPRVETTSSGKKHFL